MTIKIKEQLAASIFLYCAVILTAHGAQHFDLQIGNDAIPSSAVNAVMLTNQLLSTRRASKQILIFKKSIRDNNEPQINANQTLTNDSLVVIGIDSNGNKLTETVTTDPRVIHAQLFTSNGHSEPAPNLYLPRADLSFTLPGNQLLDAIRVYQVDWNGGIFSRNLLGQVVLP